MWVRDVSSLPDAARVTLGVIRLANGVVALVAPSVMLGQLGSARGLRTPAVYALRMFGVRTVYLGLDLLAGGPEHQRQALERAPLIHASDALAAFAAGAAGHLPSSAARKTVAISCVNLALALLARSGAREERRLEALTVGARTGGRRDNPTAVRPLTAAG